MLKIRIVFFLLAVLALLADAPDLHAVVVTEVGPDGTLTLEDGKQVTLAGIRMDAEGISVLRVLARKQDLKFQLLTNFAGNATESAYAYLQSKHVTFPVKPEKVPDEQEILINEFLVRIGAARVDDAQDFSHKDRLLKAQEEAKKRGEGIWSYEIS